MANFLVMACAMPFAYRPMPALDLGGLGLMAVLGFCGGLCIIAAYRIGRAVVVAPMQYSQILWAVIYGYLFFGEVPDRATALGAVIIIVSGIYIVFREDRIAPASGRPVLGTRSRFVSGTYPRISTFRRLFRRVPAPDARNSAGLPEDERFATPSGVDDRGDPRYVGSDVVDEPSLAPGRRG
jgi:S-adenosylmethionine uptake transporter